MAKRLRDVRACRKANALARRTRLRRPRPAVDGGEAARHPERGLRRPLRVGQNLLFCGDERVAHGRGIGCVTELIQHLGLHRHQA